MLTRKGNIDTRFKAKANKKKKYDRNKQERNFFTSVLLLENRLFSIIALI